MTTIQDTEIPSHVFRFVDDDFTAADVSRCLDDAPAWASLEGSDIGASAPDEESDSTVGWVGPAIDFGDASARLYRFDRFKKDDGLLAGELVAQFWLGNSDLVDIHIPQEARDGALALLKIASDLEHVTAPKPLPETEAQFDGVDGTPLGFDMVRVGDHTLDNESGSWGVRLARRDGFENLDAARAYLVEVADLIALAERLNAAAAVAPSA